MIRRKFTKFKPVIKLAIASVVLLELILYFLYSHSVWTTTQTLSVPTNDVMYAHLIDLFHTDSFAKQPMEHKCHTYFDELYQFDAQWELGDFENLQYIVPLAKDKKKYERELFKMRRRGISGLTREQRMSLKADTSQEIKRLVMNNLAIENLILNSVGHLKIFGKCLIDTGVNLMKFQMIEQKLFPWLTRQLPEYKRWDGTVVSDRIPVVDHYLHPNEVQNNNATYSQEDSYIQYLHNSMAGQGVVLSISDLQVNNTIKLIKVLRYLQNTIPVQLVHKGDLSQLSQNRLISAARNEFKVAAPPMQQAAALDHHDNMDEITVSGFKQELWFVDASRCVSPIYLKSKFELYANKWLAVLFNSFDDAIFLDDDSIPFVNPAYFFELPKFKKFGNLFYKDREIEGKMEDNFHNLYLTLLPSTTDERLFEIKKPSANIKAQRFFTQRTRHHMESGLVVLKRSAHLTGLLIATHLQIWTPTSTPVHGDKELFWLGQIIAGSPIVFNELPAGAAGYVPRYETVNSICSIQPSHIHDGDHRTLLWVNSGLRQCKYETWDEDITLEAYKYNHTADSLRQWFESPLAINTAIIPPDALRVYNNRDNNPPRGWSKRNDLGCMQYYFCAHDKVGGNREKDWKAFGKLIRYTEEEQAKFASVARVWNSNL